jgi:hypothetical protein
VTALDVCRYWSKEDHERAQLQSWADMLVGIVPFSRPPPDSSKPDLSKPTSPMRELIMSDFQRRQLANCLRRIAATPAALMQGTAPRTAHRMYKIATDYAATYERLGKEVAAVLEVMSAWDVGRSTVLSAHQKLSSAARHEIQRLEREHDMPRNKLLSRISETLRGQEKLGPKKQRE